jgi:hypothetical protein
MQIYEPPVRANESGSCRDAFSARKTARAKEASEVEVRRKKSAIGSDFKKLQTHYAINFQNADICERSLF